MASLRGDKAGIESFRGDAEAVSAVDVGFRGETNILTCEELGKVKLFEVVDGGGLLEEIRMEAN